MEENEKDKTKDHMLSGFFDRCRDMYESPPGKLDEQAGAGDISGEIAKTKLKQIKKILNA